MVGLAFRQGNIFFPADNRHSLCETNNWLIRMFIPKEALPQGIVPCWEECSQECRHECFWFINFGRNYVDNLEAVCC